MASKLNLYSFRRLLTPYLYILPVLLIILMILVFPIVQVFYDSFFHVFGEKKTFVGIDNFRFLFFEDYIFRKAFFNNVKLLIIIPVMSVMAITIAYILFVKVSNYKIFQFIFFLPVILSIAVTGVVFRYILRFDGVLNGISTALRVNVLIQDWLGNPDIAIFSIIMVIIWKELGFGIVLFLAKILALDYDTFNAAKIDGANSIIIFTKIVVPQLKSLISFYVTYIFIVIFAWTFGYIFVMTNGGPGLSTVTLEYAIYSYLIFKNMPDKASALALILFAIVSIFVYLQSVFRLRIED